MPAGLSTLSLAASGVYAFVLLSCTAAAITSRRFRQAPGHYWTWLTLAILFGVLIALRLAAAEEWLRATFRASVRASGEYDQRRQLQGPIVAAIFVIAGTGALALLYRTTRHLRGRRNVALLVAVFAALAMVFLLALRLASLHAIDALLYGGAKLNWLIDLGASLAVMLAAATYIRLVRARP